MSPREPLFAVVETWLDEERQRILEYDVKDSQYQWFGKVEQKLVGRRGLGMLVRKCLNPRIAKKSVSADLLWVMVGEQEESLVFGGSVFSSQYLSREC